MNPALGLGKMLHIRQIPELRFLLDQTEDRAQHIDEILDRIAHSRSSSEAQGEGREGPVLSREAGEELQDQGVEEEAGESVDAEEENG